MSNAIREWLKTIDDYPGWREWKRQKIGHTLHFDDQFPSTYEEPLEDFHFSEEIEEQHAVIIRYLELQQAIANLKDCEYYFRRYPFRGLPVTRHNHITNICEMFFGRFYEVKERIKKYFDAVSVAVPNHGLEIGGFIKDFEKEFDQELRARNLVDHHRRFEDLAIDRIFLTESILPNMHESWKREHIAAYRKLSKEWAERVRRRSAKMDEFLEAVAIATLAKCSFLSVLIPKDTQTD